MNDHKGDWGDWWETSDGDHIEPVGGALSAAFKSSGHETDASRWVDSHRDLTFGNGEKPGILGTGRFQGQYYLPGQDASQIPGYDNFQQLLAQGWQAAPNRAAAQMDSTYQNQVRGQQQGLADALTARANGTGGPSVAELQMQRGADTNMAQAMGLMGAQRGQNAGLSMRGIANQRAAMGQQNAMDSSLLRAQETSTAQNTLGQLLGGMRGQDIGVASGNLQAQQQQRQMNDQMVQFYTSQGMSMAQAQQQAAMEMEKLRVQQNLAQTQQQQKAYEDSAQANANLVKSVMSFGLSNIGGGGGGGGK